MKLYFKPGACSLASHIVLKESGSSFELEKVDTETKLTESNRNYLTINPKGYVPALELTSGDTITEGPAILQFLADKFSDKNLLPGTGTIERTKVIESLTYTSSELHKAFSPLFKSDTSDEAQSLAKASVAEKFDFIEQLLTDDREFIVGGQFSIADAYLFVVCNWSNFVGITIKNWPKLEAYVSRIAQRASVQRAMKSEGLI
jgi:glutathione S-transferase